MFWNNNILSITLLQQYFQYNRRELLAELLLPRVADLPGQRGGRGGRPVQRRRLARSETPFAWLDFTLDGNTICVPLYPLDMGLTFGDGRC